MEYLSGEDGTEKESITSSEIRSDTQDLIVRIDSKVEKRYKPSSENLNKESTAK